MMALRAKYHPKCLTALCNRQRKSKSLRTSCTNEEDKHDNALKSVVSHIEDAVKGTEISPVFKLSNLRKLYEEKLKSMGIAHEVKLHSTRLKNRLLSSIPGLTAHKEGCEVVLAFNQDIAEALTRACDNDEDNAHSVLVKASSLVRKDMLTAKNSFTGHFEFNCQENSVPESLHSLVKMMLYGSNESTETCKKMQ